MRLMERFYRKIHVALQTRFPNGWKRDTTPLERVLSYKVVSNMSNLSILLFHASMVILISSQRPNAYPEVIELCRGTTDDYLDLSKVKISHLKNGTYGLNGNIIIKKDLPNTATVSVRLLKKNSAGIWTSGFLMASPDMNICTYVKVDTMLFPVITRHSNLPQQCPFFRGNYVFNSSDWNAPTALGQDGCFKVIFSVKNKRKPIACVSLIVKLVGANGSRLPRCV